ncbi:MAG: hypothetical protein IAF58_23320 [Leptolyngbya sp.]|nr:hypothetical protein [Candidatus Melainabacteria bacterium]
MSLPETQTIQIKVLNPAAYTLNHVVAEARSCAPQDLNLACANVDLSETTGKVVAEVSEFVNFVVTDFFSLLHRSGLYNRQKALWESIARAIKVSIYPVTQGLFRKEDLPIFDVHFEDSNGATTVLALVVQSHAKWKDEKYVIGTLKELLHRAGQLDRKRPSLRAILIVAPKPFSKALLTHVEKMIGGQDPVARYESVLPAPLNIHIDLIEYGTDLDNDDSEAETHQLGALKDASGSDVSNETSPRGFLEDDPNIIGDETALHPNDLRPPSDQKGRFSFQLVQPALPVKRRSGAHK